MRYLDREPRDGDRVHVEMTGVVGKVYPNGSVSFNYGGETQTLHARAATVRVIAPEPKVGDVVTEDMDLPEGSIIEYNREQLMGATGYNIAVRRLERWRMTHTQGDIPALDGPGDWRIVRIGPAQ